MNPRNGTDRSPITKQLQESLKRVPGLERAARAVRGSDEPPLWKDLVRADRRYWKSARRRAQRGSRVLIASSMGGYPLGTLLESTLAVALTLRGAKVDVLLCDGLLPACQLTEIQKVSPLDLADTDSQPRCATCHPAGQSVFGPLGLTIHWFGKLLDRGQMEIAERIASEVPLDQISDYTMDGLAVGEHAMAGALRYFARGDLESEPHALKIAHRYLKSAILTVQAVTNLLESEDYDLAVFNHGIYVPQGLITEVCRQQHVKVVTWNPAYRKNSFILSHNDSYHHTMISEPTDSWADMHWDGDSERNIMDYLNTRRRGTEDWIWFHDQPQEDLSNIEQETGLDFSRPVVGMLTNVIWDAQLHYESNAFSSMLEWVLRSIEYFAGRPEIQLAIRVHPAEVRGSVPSRQPLVEEIERAFPSLPANVRLIPPESQVSTYTLVENCDAVTIYNTKTGVEAACMGVPVVVAGEAWIRGKGFSRDAYSADEYFAILDELPFNSRLEGEELERARRYAYHFFFRRMIPLPFITSEEGRKYSLELNNLSDLEPGGFAGLDVMCEGILNSNPFNYSAAQTVLE